MHAARISRSPRLQRCLSALRKHPEGISTRDLIIEANICAVSSVVAELRVNGADIECEQRKTPEGRGFFYTLKKAPDPQNDKPQTN